MLLATAMVKNPRMNVLESFCFLFFMLGVLFPVKLIKCK